MHHQNNNKGQESQTHELKTTSEQKTLLSSLGQHQAAVPDAAQTQAYTQKLLRIMAGCVIGALIIAALVVGKEIFIPLALAILLAFLLAPVVMRLRKWGCPQLAAIMLTVVMAVGVLAGATSYLGFQLSSLSQQLPKYQDTIKQKLNSVRKLTQGPSVWDGALSTFDTVEHSFDSAAQNKKDDSDVQKVKVVGQEQSAAQSVMEWADRVLNPLASAGIVFLFVILILLNRKDLHDRFLKIIGGNLNVGTDALDEAGSRIGTYLRMQLLVNSSYGVPLALGLWIIGVPAAIMWGMLAVVMRFIPYVGPMISAIFPITLAFAVDPGWHMVLWTVTIILVMELISNNIIEPWLYGESTGLSTLAIILAATFWTALWGPIGLILSTPLTACLLVLSNYVPALSFIKTLLGSAPVLTPPERFYQRLVADEVDDAMDVANDYVHDQLPKNASDELIARKVNAFYEDAALPAVQLFSSGHNTDASAEHRLRMHVGLKQFNHAFQQQYPSKISHQQPEVYCVGARWEIDVQASSMIAHALNLRKIPAAWADDALILSQSSAMEQIPSSVKILCISIFHANPEAQIRLLAQKLRNGDKQWQLVFALWNDFDYDILDGLQKQFALDGVISSLNDLMLCIEALRLQEGESWLSAQDIPDMPAREQALRELEVLDSSNQPIYEQYLEEAQQAFDVKYTQISWIYPQAVYTPMSLLAAESSDPMQAHLALEDSICTHLVYQNEDLLIEDLQRDPRFAQLSELSGNRIRFYAGVPLRAKNGLALGSFCLLDKRTHELEEDDLALLKELADDLMLTLSNASKKREKIEQINQLNE